MADTNGTPTKPPRLDSTGKPRIDKGHSATGRENNLLNSLQSYKLMTYVDSNRDRLEKEGRSQPEVAEEATKHLGFTVTANNVRKAGIELGVKIRKTAKAAGASGSTKWKGRLQVVEAQLAEVTERLARIEEGLGLKS